MVASAANFVPGSVPGPLAAPIFVIAAPRSGSSLLFETLAQSARLATVGGEAHWLLNSIPTLRLGANGVDSHRLGAQHATPFVIRHMTLDIMARLVDYRGSRVSSDSTLVFLEKTPKHSLCVPFFAKAFPNAKFLFLWRDPRENVSSLMEAWRCGRFVTHRKLDGLDGPWTMILPPGYKAMRDKPVADIAAFQWRMTNQIALDDLESLPASRWSSLRYDQLLESPKRSIEDIFKWADLEIDLSLLQRVSGPLPVSRSTQTKPAPDKWRHNEREILRILPEIEPLWRRLEALGRDRAPAPADG